MNRRKLLAALPLIGYLFVRRAEAAEYDFSLPDGFDPTKPNPNPHTHTINATSIREVVDRPGGPRLDPFDLTDEQMKEFLGPFFERLVSDGDYRRGKTAQMERVLGSRKLKLLAYRSMQDSGFLRSGFARRFVRRRMGI